MFKQKQLETIIAMILSVSCSVVFSAAYRVGNDLEAMRLSLIILKACVSTVELVVMPSSSLQCKQTLSVPSLNPARNFCRLSTMVPQYILSFIL